MLRIGEKISYEPAPHMEDLVFQKIQRAITVTIGDKFQVDLSIM